jgi:DnaD/phage-associated family protein
MNDFLTDELFMGGMGVTPHEAQANLAESLNHAVHRGTFLQVSIQLDQEHSLYFLNTSRGRAAVQAIQNGEWRPSDDPHLPVELSPERPSIYHLYEQNIGPMTPLLADILQDAEDTYPAEWIEEAFRIAVEKNVRNWRYVEAILRRWHERGYDGRETRRDTEKSRRQYADWEAN